LVVATSRKGRGVCACENFLSAFTRKSNKNEERCDSLPQGQSHTTSHAPYSTGRQISSCHTRPDSLSANSTNGDTLS
jgi:hypothetical protein